MKLYRFLFIGISLFSCQSKEHIKVITKEVIVKEKYNPIEQDSPNPLFDCYEGSQLDVNICSSKELA
ncbi:MULTISPECIES: hypothetical protein [Flavobacterium]|uniref:Lipoprotein n=1 Tax=Flavobacterium covae TaxID=2906076 RepID=A0ABW8PJS5_9FLAO|nr:MULTISPECIES: hypothetical protein [Flavobacterium]MCJ1805940.1 hypothetical protein [Flavobacterium covae]MCJ1809704.1 hypothetical protein [Flavobacterium covae]